jgi:hypothetical protein
LGNEIEDDKDSDRVTLRYYQYVSRIGEEQNAGKKVWNQERKKWELGKFA